MKVLSTLAALVLEAIPAAAAGQSAPAGLAIVHATVIDGTGRAPIPDATIVVRGGRIVAVGPDAVVAVPRGARVLDGRGKWVIPGLMDANVHLSSVTDAESLLRFENQYDRIVLEAAQVTLRSGVTTVFDTDGEFDALQATRGRIARGEAVGSRIFFAGHIIGFGGPISPDGDDALAALVTRDFVRRTNARWVRGVGPELSWMGPDEVRPIVARYAAGAEDFLKYGGSGHKQEAMITFSPRVQRVIVEEAHRAGKTVQAHAVSPESFDMALDAGVDIVTHCDITGPYTPIPAATLRKMRERGTFCSILPVTSALVASLVQWRGADDPYVRHNVVSRENDRNLIAAGIPLMLSTDGSLDNPVEAAESRYPRVDSRIILGEGIFNALAALEESGMAPLEILRTATLNVARGYRVDRDLGSIESGKWADLVILDRDPLASARNYRAIDTVIKAGVPVDRAALPTAPLVTSRRPSN